MDPPPRDKLGGDPIEIAGLFEGDIAGVHKQDMVGVKSRSKTKPPIKVSGRLSLRNATQSMFLPFDLGRIISCQAHSLPTRFYEPSRVDSRAGRQQT